MCQSTSNKVERMLHVKMSVTSELRDSREYYYSTAQNNKSHFRGEHEFTLITKEYKFPFGARLKSCICWFRDGWRDAKFSMQFYCSPTRYTDISQPHSRRDGNNLSVGQSMFINCFIVYTRRLVTLTFPSTSESWKSLLQNRVM